MHFELKPIAFPSDIVVDLNIKLEPPVAFFKPLLTAFLID